MSIYRCCLVLACVFASSASAVPMIADAQEFQSGIVPEVMNLGLGAFGLSRVVFLGIVPNGAGNSGVIEPEFLLQDISDIERDVGRRLGESPSWTLVSLENEVTGRDVNEGNVLYAALVISRAEITRTEYEVLGITKHSAWITLSLEFFNLRSRAIYFSSVRSGVKAFDTEERELDGRVRMDLLLQALREIAPSVVDEAIARFDPDFVQGAISASKDSPGLWELATATTVGIGPGHILQSIKPVCGTDASPRNCRFYAVQVSAGVVLLQAEAGDKPTKGLLVSTFANKKDPPGVRTFQVAPFVPFPGGRSLDGDLEFLRMQLHGQLASVGSIRLVSPVDLAFSADLLRRFESSLLLTTSETQAIMERPRPSFLIRSAVAKLDRQYVRGNSIESEEAFVALLASRVSEADWNAIGEDGEPTRTPVTGVLYGNGLALNRILPGKRIVERDLFLIAAQEAVADLGAQILAAVEAIGRGATSATQSAPQ